LRMVKGCSSESPFTINHYPLTISSSEKMDSEKKYYRNARVAAVNFGNDKALLNVETGKYLYLNETGSRIWDLLESGMTLAELTGKMFLEYETEVATAHAKIEKFLEKALAAKVIFVKSE